MVKEAESGFWEGAVDKARSGWDLLNKLETPYRDAVIGTGLGALAGGGLGALTGRGFLSGALLGAGLGGGVGYFRQPLQQALGSIDKKIKTEHIPESTDPPARAPEIR